MSFTCTCGFFCCFIFFCEGHWWFIDRVSTTHPKRKHTHTQKANRQRSWSMQHEPWESRRSIHPAATKAPGSGCTKEAPRETNVARVGCLCAKAPSLATAARKETLRPKQPARVVDCYKEITLTIVMLSFACYFETLPCRLFLND